MFRILGSVDTLNERMNVNLTHHDVNWVYNRYKLIGQGYNLKTRVSIVRLILCHPKSNKGMDKDYLIVSGEWHDGLHYPTQEGTLGGVLRFRFMILTIPPLLLMFFVLIFSIFTCKYDLTLFVLFFLLHVCFW